jgi:DNA-directed RNA polymerase subunit M/transcription elongation factor TFIIS
MPNCPKCNVSMKPEKEKVDDYYRFYWRCPSCGFQKDYAMRPAGKKK